MYTVCDLYATSVCIKHGVHTFFEGSVTLRTVSTSSMTSYTGGSSVVIGRLFFCRLGHWGKGGPLGFTSLDVQTAQGAWKPFGMARFGGLRTVSALLRDKLAIGLCSVSMGPSTNPAYSWLSSGIFMLSSYNIEHCGIALFLCGTEQICICLSVCIWTNIAYTSIWTVWSTERVVHIGRLQLLWPTSKMYLTVYYMNCLQISPFQFNNM